MILRWCDHGVGVVFDGTWSPAQRIAAASTPQAASTLLSHTLAELALLDEASKTQAHVWLAFVSRAPAA